MSVLVYALHYEGEFNKNSLGAVSEGAKLAKEVGGEAAAVVVGGDDLSDAKDFAGRIFIQPFKSGSFRPLGVGIAASVSREASVNGSRWRGLCWLGRLFYSSTTPPATLMR